MGDEHKSLLELTEEIYSHTRSKTKSSLDQFQTVYNNNPLKFNKNNENIKELLKNGDISKPLGYLQPRRKYNEIRIDKDWIR